MRPSPTVFRRSHRGRTNPAPAHLAPVTDLPVRPRPRVTLRRSPDSPVWIRRIGYPVKVQASAQAPPRGRGDLRREGYRTANFGTPVWNYNMTLTVGQQGSDHLLLRDVVASLRVNYLQADQGLFGWLGNCGGGPNSV